MSSEQHKARRPMMPHLCGILMILIANVAACSPTMQRFDVRRRDPNMRLDDRLLDASLNDAYKEEYAYVRSRRLQLSGARPDAEWTQKKTHPAHLIGLALSGGGIRSATFNLGAIQALRDSDVFDQVDYLSSVSGGSYLAGWLQAHLGARNNLPEDVYAYDVGAGTALDLLDVKGDQVEQLRVHSGFINQGGWFEGFTFVGDWLWRWPFHIVIDGIFNLHTFDFQHVNKVYQNRIEGTYFRGDPQHDRAVRPKRAVRLIDINAPGREALTPYTIINANLTNTGASQISVSYPHSREKGEHWNFEFTRDFSGSDGTGYVDSKGLGLPVRNTSRTDERVVSADVETDGIEASPFRLSEAVVASGAAFDSVSLGGWLNAPVVSEATQFVSGGLLNLHLGLDVPNFARTLNGRTRTTLDYGRMLTYQRVPRFTDTGARWLHVTDGGFYENLGVLSLLRRGASCVIALDATADPARSYEDLRTLRRRVQEELQLEWLSPLPPDGEAPDPVYRFQIGDSNGTVRAAILYVKATADATFPHLRTEQPTAAERQEVLRKEMERVVLELHKLIEELLTDLREDPNATPADVKVVTSYQKKIDGRLSALSSWIDRNVPPSGTAASQSDAFSTGGTDLQTLHRAINQHEKKAARQLDIVRLARTRLTAAKQKLGSKQLEHESEATVKPQATPTPCNDGVACPPHATTAMPTEQPRDIKAIEDSIENAKTQLETAQADLDHTLASLNLANRQLLVHRETIWSPEILSKTLPEFDEIDNRGTELFLSLKNAHSGFADRFALIIARSKDRALRALRANLESELRDAARRDRIRRIQAFATGSLTFPHDSTLVQWYTWERFEAYRLLGYQMASTYLDHLSPDDSSLNWCDFSKELPVDQGKR
jgi:hypothetical protein